ncbi:cytochrome c oxidase subunit VB-domain-containing protein [Rhizophagus diaphanus]|nr:cytochrome c oxidase subunit VB-domain-containing protein [Rhizophagus diaphanus] [Rhizophagus sp. MUCL 43196]
MLSSALRSTVGSVRTIVSRGVIRQPHSSKARAFSVLSPRFGELSSNFFGPGAKPGTVADDIDQATGIERAELLSKLEGKDIYDLSPLKITAVGTKKEPVMVKSVDPVRFVGCTGFPVDSHETVWLGVDKNHEFDRCPECGQIFKLDFIGSENEGHGHH